MSTQVHLTLDSKNRKTGRMATTYYTKDTCPLSCPFNRETEEPGKRDCYAGQGPMGNSAFRIAERHGIDDLAAHADRIRALPEGIMVREAVGGQITEEIAQAIMPAYAERPDLSVGTYIHGWDTRSPSEFPSNVVVNASCETSSEIEKATANGWPVAVVLTGEADPLIGSTVAGKRVIVCPAQQREETTCASCRLCWKADRQVHIGFLPHGATRKVTAAVQAKRDALG